MPNPPKKSSAYAEFLYFKIDEYFQKQGSAFTVEQLAAYTGLKPTCNFRRRLRHAVASGKLALSSAYAWNGSRGNLYSMPSTDASSDIPF